MLVYSKIRFLATCKAHLDVMELLINNSSNVNQLDSGFCSAVIFGKLELSF